MDEVNVGDESVTEYFEEVNLDNSVEAPTDSAPKSFVAPEPKKKRMTKLSRVENAIAKLQKITDKPRSASTSSTETDEVSAFGTLVATQLRTLPTRNRITLQDKILSLISQERLKLSESPRESPMLYSSPSLYGNDSDEDYIQDGTRVYTNLH